jgi:hypothetical protein
VENSEGNRKFAGRDREGNKKLSKHLSAEAISKIRKDAQTIIAIRDEINYINGLMGITNQTQPQYYFLPTNHADEAVREEILQQAITKIKKVKESVQNQLQNNLKVDDVTVQHKSIITTILDIEQNIKMTNSSAHKVLQTSMSELQALSLKWFHDRFFNEGGNYCKNNDACDFKKDTEAFKLLYRDDDVALDKTENKVHISGARLDVDNKKLFNEIWENIIKMGKTARLIGRINTDGLIDNGKLSETRNEHLFHISGKEIKWTQGDIWEGMKLVLTDQLEVKELRHVYKASKASKIGTTITESSTAQSESSTAESEASTAEPPELSAFAPAASNRNVFHMLQAYRGKYELRTRGCD